MIQIHLLLEAFHPSQGPGKRTPKQTKEPNVTSGGWGVGGLMYPVE